MAKKIINGKLYNTATATFIGEYANDISRSDFRYYEEELYRKRTGEYFLSGEGGPLTKYAKYLNDGCRTYGKDILPLSIEEAKRWVEYYMSADDYIKEFGEVEE